MSAEIWYFLPFSSLPWFHKNSHKKGESLGGVIKRKLSKTPLLYFTWSICTASDL